ncbi:uncharacterized protein BXZ73DRAFT_101433 [Epithele typhae]|uniref:uncharacterized protein n=1 Tax=Epithele typhae TaxID=378194 RepID=UPI00200752DB|nr:uncharacterized protein BXZ73DRAFT_101433 [Epithele typhae]KAH9932058.1 hypothetical protein BXZ73DRAFT_101433 [Epithele typhae]
MAGQPAARRLHLPSRCHGARRPSSPILPRRSLPRPPPPLALPIPTNAPNAPDPPVARPPPPFPNNPLEPTPFRTVQDPLRKVKEKSLFCCGEKHLSAVSHKRAVHQRYTKISFKNHQSPDATFTVRRNPDSNNFVKMEHNPTFALPSASTFTPLHTVQPKREPELGSSGARAFLDGLRRPLGHLAPHMHALGLVTDADLDLICALPSAWDELGEMLRVRGMSVLEWLMIKEAFKTRFGRG